MWLIPALKLNSKSLSNSPLFPNMCWNFAKKCWQSAKCKLSAGKMTNVKVPVFLWQNICQISAENWPKFLQKVPQKPKRWEIGIRIYMEPMHKRFLDSSLCNCWSPSEPPVSKEVIDAWRVPSIRQNFCVEDYIKFRKCQIREHPMAWNCHRELHHLHHCEQNE